MTELPLDARIRELWKAVAITASEHETPFEAVNRADHVTMSFIRRFFPDDETAAELKRGIRTENHSVREHFKDD